MEEKKQNAFMSWWMPKWRSFEEKSPNLAKWVYKIFYFFVFMIIFPEGEADKKENA